MLPHDRKRKLGWAGLQGVLWLDRDHKDMEVTTWHNQLSEQKGLDKGGTPTQGGQFGGENQK